MTQTKKPIYLLSGGSEISALAIFEFLCKHDFPVFIISRNQSSLFSKTLNSEHLIILDWVNASVDVTRNLINHRHVNVTCELPLLVPTEDSSLDFMMCMKDHLQEHFEYPFNSCLTKSGYDKAEFFEYLMQQPDLKGILPETYIAHSVEECLSYFTKAGKSLVIKPATKPRSMEFGGMPSKVLFIEKETTSSSLIELLEEHWHLSSKWLIQEACFNKDDREYMWAGTITSQGEIAEFTAVELAKYPAIGGTSCLVMSKRLPEISELAKCVTKAIRFEGICEISFRKNAAGDYKIIELNPRPWLQVGLSDASQSGLLEYLLLTGHRKIDYMFLENVLWISIERIILGIIKGQRGIISESISAIRQANRLLIPPYNSKLRGVKSRWLKRMLGSLFQKTGN